MLRHCGHEYLERELPDRLRKRINEPRADLAHGMTEPIPHVDGAPGEVMEREPTTVINRETRKKLHRFFAGGSELEQKSTSLRNIETHLTCADGRRSSTKDWVMSVSAPKML